MLRLGLVITLLAALAYPVAAQAPDGWQVRIDRSENAQDPDNVPQLMVMQMGNGFHVVGGPAGTFWNPGNAAKGAFTARATFTLNKPSSHPNYYGLVFGGGDLAGANQTYIYFLVAQNGQYLVRRRVGANVTDVKAATAHEAVRRPAANGQSSNTLEVRVTGDTISYVVNGTVVHTTPRAGATAQTDGLVGVRINHVLDVMVGDFAVQRG